MCQILYFINVSMETTNNNNLIKNTFQQNQGFIIIGSLHLVLKSLPVIFDKVKEYIWRDFGPFLLAYPFKILHILDFVVIN